MDDSVDLVVKDLDWIPKDDPKEIVAKKSVDGKIYKRSTNERGNHIWYLQTTDTFAYEPKGKVQKTGKGIGQKGDSGNKKWDKW